MVIMHQTVNELFDYMPAGPVKCSFMQYSITFCSQPEVASDVLAGVAVEDVGIEVSEEVGSSASNGC